MASNQWPSPKFYFYTASPVQPFPAPWLELYFRCSPFITWNITLKDTLHPAQEGSFTNNYWIDFVPQLKSFYGSPLTTGRSLDFWVEHTKQPLPKSV